MVAVAPAIFETRKLASRRWRVMVATVISCPQQHYGDLPRRSFTDLQQHYSFSNLQQRYGDTLGDPIGR
jgi:hypothetical protein